MGQIHVPLLTGGASGAGRWNGLSVRDRGEAVALLDGPLRLETAYCLSDVGTIQVGLPIHT
jgi:hypothetical protein